MKFLKHKFFMILSLLTVIAAAETIPAAGSDYIAGFSVLNESPDLLENAYIGERQAYISCYGYVNVRAEAEETSERVGSLRYRQEVVIEGAAENGFYHIISGTDAKNGDVLEGYVLAELMTEGNPPDSYIMLDVIDYKQNDERWKELKLGETETMGSGGCTTTCLAMFYSYIEDTVIDPGVMREQISYTRTGDLTFPTEEFVHANEPYILEKIFDQLEAGYPVFYSRINPSTTSHWVLVVGYVGDGVNFTEEDFIINDPATGERTNLLQFKEDYSVFNKIVYYDPATAQEILKQKEEENRLSSLSESIGVNE